MGPVPLEQLVRPDERAGVLGFNQPALEQSELRPRELAVRFTDERSYFVGSDSLQLLKARDPITNPASVVIKAADRFHTQIKRPNEQLRPGPAEKRAGARNAGSGSNCCSPSPGLTQSRSSGSRKQKKRSGPRFERTCRFVCARPLSAIIIRRISGSARKRERLSVRR